MQHLEDTVRLVASTADPGLREAGKNPNSNAPTATYHPFTSFPEVVVMILVNCWSNPLHHNYTGYQRGLSKARRQSSEHVIGFRGEQRGHGVYQAVVPPMSHSSEHESTHSEH
jgi:hypothetical protein